MYLLEDCIYWSHDTIEDCICWSYDTIGLSKRLESSKSSILEMDRFSKNESSSVQSSADLARLDLLSVEASMLSANKALFTFDVFWRRGVMMAVGRVSMHAVL